MAATIWQAAMEAGWHALKRSAFAEAERQFLAALEEANKGGTADAGRARTLYWLGKLYAAQARFEPALAYYQQFAGPMAGWPPSTAGR